MSSQSTSAAAVELFYSYAHEDIKLCDLLETHLKALQRSGLIRSWYDRKIQKGSEWAPEIKAAMERAGIILLLLSPDFMASDYCYEIELPLAMKRHEAGDAVVIPILLRPFVYRDAPFAKLQMLPTGARAVIEWGRRDEAFNDVAAAIRTVILERRLEPEALVQSNTQERILDAAIPSEVLIDQPADVVSLIRLPTSAGLKMILQNDDTFSAMPDDVKSSEPFEVLFPRDASGNARPVAVEFVLQSPGFEPPEQRKTVRLKPAGDSPVCVLMLTPKRAGRLRLTLELRVNAQVIASRPMATTAVAESVAATAPKAVPYNVSEIPLRANQKAVPVAAPASSDYLGRSPSVAVHDTQQSWNYAAPQRYGNGGWGSPAPPTPATTSYRPTANSPKPWPPGAPSAPKRKSKWPAMIALSGSAAAVLLVAILIPSWTSTTGGGGTGTPPPTTGGVAPPPPPPPPVSAHERPTIETPTIETLTRGISKSPNSADLYVRRARLYLNAKDYGAALEDANRAAALSHDKATVLALRMEIMRAQTRERLAKK